MKRLKILQLFALVVLVTLAGPDAQTAAADGAQTTVKEMIKSLKAFHHQKPLTPEQQKANAAQADKTLGFLDVQQVSERALGKHWKHISPKEQKEFVTLLGNLFKVVAFPNSSKFFGEMKITYGTVEQEGRTATVPLTVLHAEEGEVGLDFILEDQNSRWRVVDVVLDGVSMRNNLRLQFYKVLKKNDFAELVRRMQKKLKEESN